MTQPTARPGLGLAFSTLACPAWSLERVAESALELGYRGVELRLLDGDLIEPDLSPAQRLRVRRVLGDAGLPAVALDTSVRLADAGSPRAADDLRALLDLAAGWEAPLIRVFGGERSDGAGGQTAPSDMARLLEAVAPEAERAGVAIALETHDRFSSAAQVAGLLALVESPAVGALWDVLHTHRAGETPERAVAELGRRLLHVHVKDGRPRPDGASWDLVLMGEGEVPVLRSLRALRDGGYRGWLSVEWEKRWHPEIEEPEVALPQHAAAMAVLLAEAGL